MLHPRPAKHFAATGTPNTLLTRTIYRAVYVPLYVTFYTVITVAAFVMRKDRLDVLQSAADKLKLDVDVKNPLSK